MKRIRGRVRLNFYKRDKEEKSSLLLEDIPAFIAISLIKNAKKDLSTRTDWGKTEILSCGRNKRPVLACNAAEEHLRDGRSKTNRQANNALTETKIFALRNFGLINSGAISFFEVSTCRQSFFPMEETALFPLGKTYWMRFFESRTAPINFQHFNWKEWNASCSSTVQSLC